MAKDKKYFRYYVVDGPWGSEEDIQALDLALQDFNLRKTEYKQVSIIKSTHPYTKGYWVESEPIKLGRYDFIILEIDKS